MSEKLNYHDKAESELDFTRSSQELGSKILETANRENSSSIERNIGSKAIKNAETKTDQQAPQIKTQQKLSLDEAKSQLATDHHSYNLLGITPDKIFQNNDPSKVNVSMYGKYLPNMTVIMPLTWDKKLKDGLAHQKYKSEDDVRIVSPFRFRACPEITDHLGIKFNAKVNGVLPIKFWTSKAGKPCCEIYQGKNIPKATHMLIKTSFDRKYGYGNSHFDDKIYHFDEIAHAAGLPQSKREEGPTPREKANITYYHHAASSGGAQGHDYCIIPIDYDAKEYTDQAPHVNNPELAKERRKLLAENYQADRAKFRAAVQEKIEREAESAKNKDRLLPQLLELDKRLKTITEEYNQYASKHQISRYAVSKIEPDGNMIKWDSDTLEFNDQALAYIEDYVESIETDLKSKLDRWKAINEIKAASQDLLNDIKDTAQSKNCHVDTSDIDGLIIRNRLGNIMLFGWDNLPEALRYLTNLD